MGTVKITKISSYDLNSSPAFSAAIFLTQEELEERRRKKLLEERILKINKIRNDTRT